MPEKVDKLIRTVSKRVASAGRKDADEAKGKDADEVTEAKGNEAVSETTEAKGQEAARKTTEATEKEEVSIEINMETTSVVESPEVSKAQPPSVGKAPSQIAMTDGPRPCFTKSDIGKMVKIQGGLLWVDGEQRMPDWYIAWISGQPRPSKWSYAHHDCEGKIESVEEKVSGKVMLWAVTRSSSGAGVLERANIENPPYKEPEPYKEPDLVWWQYLLACICCPCLIAVYACIQIFEGLCGKTSKKRGKTTCDDDTWHTCCMCCICCCGVVAAAGKISK